MAQTFQKLPGINNPGSLIVFQKMFFVAGHNVIGDGRRCAFIYAVVRLVG
jgi:hypothetical protein